MEFIDLIKERFSVRSFSDKKVEEKKIEKIIEAGHLAPTGCNFQPQKILVIESEDAISTLKKCTRCHFDAPLAMLVCYDKERCWTRKYDGEQSGVVDASIVTTHMMLKAWEEGVGSTWVMHFDPFAMRTEFNIPDNIIPVALLVMGYAADDAEPKHYHNEFREIDDVVTYNKF